MLVFLAISVHVSVLRHFYLLQVSYFKIALIACVCGKYFKENVTSDLMKYSRQQSSNIMLDFSFLQKVLPDFYMCLWTCCFMAMEPTDRP